VEFCGQTFSLFGVAVGLLIVMLCGLVGKYELFGKTYHLRLQDWNSTSLHSVHSRRSSMNTLQNTEDQNVQNFAIYSVRVWNEVSYSHVSKRNT
jgi:hypothetical protein